MNESRSVRIILADGTELEGFEAEVEMDRRGVGYSSYEVPTICAEDYSHPLATANLPTKSVRLFAVPLSDSHRTETG